MTVGVLAEHLALQEDERESWGAAYQDHDLVFCEPDGSPYDPDTATTRFERRSAEAGLIVIRLHDSRHTHATLLLENGEPLKYVAERLGIREDTALRIYGHITPKMRAQAPSRLANLIDSGTKCDRNVIARPDNGVHDGLRTESSSGTWGRLGALDAELLQHVDRALLLDG